MPACVVEGCSPGSRGADSGAILHVFPKDKDMIRKWLLATGQQFEDLEDFISRIYKGKKSDTYRMCSKHFSPESYMYKPQSKKRKLTPNAVPSIFTKPTDSKDPSSEGLPPSKIRRKNIPDTISGHLKPGDRCPTCSQLIPRGLALPPSEDVAEKSITQVNRATALHPTYGSPSQYGQGNVQSISVKIVKIGIIPHGSSLQPGAGITETLMEHGGNATVLSHRTTNQGFIRTQQSDELVPNITRHPGEGITIKLVQRDGNATVLTPAYGTTNQYVQETIQGLAIKTEQPDESQNVPIKTEPDDFVPLRTSLQSIGGLTEKLAELDGKAAVLNPTYRPTNPCVRETVQDFTIKTEQPDESQSFTIKIEQPDELVPLSSSPLYNEKSVKEDGKSMEFHPNPTYGTLNNCLQETVQRFGVQMKQPNEYQSFIIKTERLDHSLSRRSSLWPGEGIVEKLATIDFNPTYEASNRYVQETSQRASIKTEQPDEFQNFTIKTEQLDELILQGSSLQPGDGNYGNIS